MDKFYASHLKEEKPSGFGLAPIKAEGQPLAYDHQEAAIGFTVTPDILVFQEVDGRKLYKLRSGAIVNERGLRVD